MVSGGIYRIRNKRDGKIYIGSTIDFQKRWALHRRRLNKGNHHAHHLQSAWNKYGASSFAFEIVEYCKDEDLLEREQYYLDTFNPEYNTSPTAGNRLGIKERQETREKKSKSARRGPLSEEESFERRVSEFINTFPVLLEREKVRNYLRKFDKLGDDLNPIELEQIDEMMKEERVLWENTFGFSRDVPYHTYPCTVDGQPSTPKLPVP